jgi:MFS family permease
MSTSSPDTNLIPRPSRWAVLALLGVAQLMVVLDATIVNIALPSAQRALHFTADNRQWVVTAYALAFGSLLLLGGKLGDLFGRKWTLIGGLIGFSVASAIGGMAQSFGMLVAARALQGAFGAILAPSALGLLTVTFQGSPDRPKAFGIFSAIAAGGASVGLLLGGVLTQLLSWRWSLYVNLAIAIPTAILAMRLLRNERQPNRARIDLPGTLLASGGLFALVYGFSSAETSSWSSTATIVSLAASVVLLIGFIAVERRVAHPLLPLHIVSDRAPCSCSRSWLRMRPTSPTCCRGCCSPEWEWVASLRPRSPPRRSGSRTVTPASPRRWSTPPSRWAVRWARPS